MILKEIVSSGVVEWPATANTPSTVRCVICKESIPREQATTGSYYADGSQAFACLEHTWHSAAWALSWLRFSEEQAQNTHRKAASS